MNGLVPSPYSIPDGIGGGVDLLALVRSQQGCGWSRLTPQTGLLVCFRTVSYPAGTSPNREALSIPQPCLWALWGAYAHLRSLKGRDLQISDTAVRRATNSPPSRL